MDLQQVLGETGVRDWASDVEGDPLRFAIVGLGWFGADVGMTAIEESEYCTATVAVSGERAKAQRVADEHGLKRGLTYEEYHDGVAADAYDAVYVTTPNALHLPIVETAAGLGKHVLCEKPLEASLDRAEQAVSACDAANVTLMVAYRMQVTPEVRRLRAVIREGLIGDPVHAQGTFTFRMRPGPDTWRVDRDLAGGAALYDIGVYPINTLRFVFDAEPVRVSGEAASPHAGFEDVDDEHVTVQLAFEAGATAACHASFNAYAENRLRVIGTGGRATIEPVFDVAADRELRVETDDGHVAVRTGIDEMVEEFDYFASAILGDTTLEPDGADGLQDMRIFEGVMESARTGEAIYLD